MALQEDVLRYVFMGLVGAAGGALTGAISYMEVHKDEGFDFKKFFKSLWLPLLVGLGSGVLSTDFKDAFIEGLVGKKLWDVGKMFVPTQTKPA